MVWIGGLPVSARERWLKGCGRPCSCPAASAVSASDHQHNQACSSPLPTAEWGLQHAIITAIPCGQHPLSPHSHRRRIHRHLCRAAARSVPTRRLDSRDGRSGSSCYAYIDYPVGTRLVVEIKNDGGDERWYVLLGEHRGRPDLRGRVALRVDGQLVFDGNVTPMRISTGARLGPISEAAVRAISTRTRTGSRIGSTHHSLCAARIWSGDQASLHLRNGRRSNRRISAAARPMHDSAMFTVKDDVSTGYANMRSGPGLGWPIIAKVPAGTGGLKRVGPCRDRDDAPGPQFCPVNWNGTTGFVSLANLDDDEPPAATTQPNVTASASPAPQPAPASPKSNNSGSGTGSSCRRTDTS